MVLQREMPVPVWGTADANESITVTFAGQTLSTKADAKGKWKVALAAMKANATAQTLTIAGPANTVTLTDVLVGEVWLCSGQSNMGLPVRSCFNQEQEIAAAKYPGIRVFTAEAASGKDGNYVFKPTLKDKLYALSPQDQCLGKWQVCSPATAPNFSAVAYYFGRDLHQKLNVPVGLIVSSVGATAIEAWISVEGLKAIPAYRERALAFEELAQVQMTAPESLSKAIEAQKARVAQRTREWFAKLDAEDKGLLNNWQSTAYDDKSWASINLPVTVDNNPLGCPVASIWFRKSVTIPQEWVGKDLLLSLGTIDAVDETYVNGTKVGRTWFDSPSYWDAKRLYTVPAAAVTSTNVTVAMRLVKLNYQMAPFGPADRMSLTLKPAAGEASATATSLAGGWQFQKAQDLDPGLQPQTNPVSATAPGLHYGNPGVMYNSLIHPIAPYAIKGAIWYQGEANAPFYIDYRSLLPGLIASWRKEWNQGDFPFGIVQLADYWGQQTAPVERGGYTNLRESQAMALSVPNTFLATAVGYGEGNDIHPKRKQEVSRQLAFTALNRFYGLKDIIPAGPMYKSMAIEGSTIRITFDNAKGLRSQGDPLVGFSIAGEDRTFHFAKAKIDAGTVVVSSDKVPKPIAVRYAWTTNPVCNLTNAENFATFPFKTDSWDLSQIVIATDEKVTIPSGWTPK